VHHWAEAHLQDALQQPAYLPKAHLTIQMVPLSLSCALRADAQVGDRVGLLIDRGSLWVYVNGKQAAPLTTHASSRLASHTLILDGGDQTGLTWSSFN
jgi:hypothetical protein